MTPDADEFLAHIAFTCAYANLSRTARTVTQTFDSALRQSGLSAGQFTILIAIALMKQPTVKPLAQQLQMDRTTLARNLRPLERDGLIEIVSGVDQRQRVIRLTARGEAALEKAIPFWRRAQETILTQIGASEWTSLMLSLQGLAQALSKDAAN